MKLAKASDSINDLNNSVKYYTQILELDPLQKEALANRGRSYIGLRQTEKAKADFKKLIRLNPKIESIRYGLASIYRVENKLDSALILCDSADKYAFSPIESHRERSNILRKQHKYEEAIHEFNELIKLEPTNGINYLNKAWSEIKLKRYDDAYFDANTAIKLIPENAFAHNDLSITLLYRNKPDDAMKEAELSLKLDDKNAFAYKNRAEIYIALKQKDKACNDLSKAKELCNDQDLSIEIDELRNKNCQK